MIKDIVVNLSVSEKEGHAAEDYAISMASALGAHITGFCVHLRHERSSGVSTNELWRSPPEVINALKREKADLAKEAAARFTKATSVAGVLAESLKLTTSFAGSIDRFGQIARSFDLAISARSNPRPTPTNDIAKGACFVLAAR